MPQPSGKGSKLLRYIEHRLRISLVDNRTIVGTFLAFDKHLNLVLVDAEEFRTLNKSRAAILEERVEKRSLGLIILRGENVVSMAVEGPPPPSSKTRVSGGPGMARGVGRGNVPPPSMGMPPPGVAPMGLGAAPGASIVVLSTFLCIFLVPTTRKTVLCVVVHGVGGMAPLGMGMPPPPPPGAMGRGIPPPGMGRGGGY